WFWLSPMRNSPFLIWGELPPMRNSSFLIGVCLPQIRKSPFLIRVWLLQIRQSRLSIENCKHRRDVLNHLGRLFYGEKGDAKPNFLQMAFPNAVFIGTLAVLYESNAVFL